MNALAALDEQIDAAKRHVKALQEIRAALAKPETPEEWIDTVAAANRFALPIDTVRYLARDKGIGRKRGGRWEISIPALQKHQRFKPGYSR